jgi:hypothetical protein
MKSGTSSAMPRLYLHAFICFAVVFTVYALTASEHVGLEDDGIFLMAAFDNGVAHPPGYPLFTLLGWVASQIPISTVAWRVHMLSALAGALTCVVIWRISLHYTRQLPAAYLAGIGFGLSSIVWSQSIVAEVYSLNSLLFFCVYYILLKASDSDFPALSGRTALAGGLLAGLGLSLHWPLFVLASLGLLPFLWRLKRLLLVRAPVIAAGLVLGLSPFVWMVYRSQAPDIAAFYGPIANWDEFIHYVLRKGYASVDVSPTAGITDQVQFALFSLRITATEYSFIAVPFMLLGIAYLFRTGGRARAMATVLGFAGPALLLPFLLHFDFDYFHQALFRVYPIPAYGFAAFWLAAGAANAANYIAGHLGPHLTILQPRWFVSMALLAVIVISNLPPHIRANDSLAEDYARMVLKELPENAILWLDSDLTTGPIGYLHRIASVRPDVALYNSRGFVFPGRLFRYNRQTDEEEKAMIERFIAATERPIVYIDQLNHPYGNRNLGLFLIADKALEKTGYEVIYNDDIVQFLHNNLISDPGRDPWSIMHRDKLISDYGTLLAQLVSSIAEWKTNDWMLAELEQVSQNLHGALAIARVFILSTDPDWAMADASLAQAEALLNNAHFKRTRADLYFFKGLSLEQRGDIKQSKEWYCKSWRAWPSRDSESFGRVDDDCKE